MNRPSAGAPTPEQFHDFLRRITQGELAVTDWNRCVVTRYSDPALETARARLARTALLCGQCSAQPWSADLANLASELLISLEVSDA